MNVKNANREELIEEIRLLKIAFHEEFNARTKAEKELEKLKTIQTSTTNCTQKQKLINHMFDAACGYGMAENNGIQSKFAIDGSFMPNKTGGTAEGGKAAFEKCMNSIPSELWEDFIYTLYRIAEKSGESGFEID